MPIEQTAFAVFVATIGQGIFRSLDGGATFNRLRSGVPVEGDVRALIARSDDPRRLLAGFDDGLYVSDDAGDSWRFANTPFDGLQVWSLSQHPDDPDTLLAGVRPAAVYRSRDGGRTWERLGVGCAIECSAAIKLTRVTCARYDDIDRRTLWAGVEIDGVYRSVDDGRTWRRTDNGLTQPDIHNLVSVPGGPRHHRILAATQTDLFVSDDGGDTWRAEGLAARFPFGYCRALAVVPGSPSTVLMGIGNGPPGSAGALLRSDDAGGSWSRIALPGRVNSTIWNIAVHPSDPKRVFVSSISGQVFASADGGRTFVKLDREFGEIRGLLRIPL